MHSLPVRSHIPILSVVTGLLCGLAAVLLKVAIRGNPPRARPPGRGRELAVPAPARRGHVPEFPHCPVHRPGQHRPRRDESPAGRLQERIQDQAPQHVLVAGHERPHHRFRRFRGRRGPDCVHGRGHRLQPGPVYGPFLPGNDASAGLRRGWRSGRYLQRPARRRPVYPGDPPVQPVDEFPPAAAAILGVGDDGLLSPARTRYAVCLLAGGILDAEHSVLPPAGCLLRVLFTVFRQDEEPLAPLGPVRRGTGPPDLPLPPAVRRRV